MSDPRTQLRKMIDGYQVAQATGAHPRALYRLLRALASVGVFTQDDGGRFAMTPLAEGLRSDVPGSLRAWAIHAGQPYMQAAWAHLHHSVVTGEPAFPHLHGTSSWHYRQQHATAGEIFDQAIGESAHDATGIVSAYDFGSASVVVDVGGGHGSLLAAILAAHPTVRGVLFDQPHVVAGAGPTLREAGVADRCTVVAGDFFAAVPSGGDLYLLKGVLHDWNDDAAARILRTCRRAMAPRSKLLVIEQVLQPDETG